MYIVTGGSGFIGSNIVNTILERHESDILVIDQIPPHDLSRGYFDDERVTFMDSGQFRDQIRSGSFQGNVEAILHQGACADTLVDDVDYMMDNNLEYSKDVLNFALEADAPLVYASSAAVYGTGQQFEEVPSNEAPLNVYGRSKLAFDNYVRGLTLPDSATVVGLRYFNVYGPNEPHKGRMASMPYQLFNQAHESGVLRIFGGYGDIGDGEQRRDFIFVGDVVDVNLFFATSPPVRGVFNVGTGGSRSFNDLAEVLIKLNGRGNVEYIPFPENLVGRYQDFTEASLDHLRDAGYTAPFTSLEDGLSKCWPAFQAARH